jgi:adenosylhomocysteine nucleosidase
MIGIMSAMEDEIKLLLKHLDLHQSRTIANREYLQGKLYGKEVILALSRWGKVAASQTATTLINLFDVTSLIFTGVAGGANPERSIGDIVISTELVQYDVDASAIPPMKQFEIPLLGISHFKADPVLVQHAVDAAQEYVANNLQADVGAEYMNAYSITTATIIKGLIASGDEFIANAEKIAELRTLLPELQCIEMEGAAVAQVCYEHQIPFVVIRSISDRADHSAVTDFPMFVKHIASHYTNGVIRGMLKRMETVA